MTATALRRGLALTASPKLDEDRQDRLRATLTEEGCEVCKVGDADVLIEAPR